MPQDIRFQHCNWQEELEKQERLGETPKADILPRVQMRGVHNKLSESLAAPPGIS